MRRAARSLHVSVLGVCLAIFVGSVSLPAQEGGVGRLEFRVKPYAAGVFIDGKYQGPATRFGWWIWFALPAGEHEVTLKDPRYHDFSTKVTIVAGQATIIKESMRPLPPPHPPYGTLRIQGGSSGYNAVYLNGRFMGHVDEFNNVFQGLMTNPGEYALTVVSIPGETELNEKVKLEEGKTTRVHVGAVR